MLKHHINLEWPLQKLLEEAICVSICNQPLWLLILLCIDFINDIILVLICEK